ncbi:hypothetical protein [Pseudonocardia kunmingensis]|uniref:Uncharacterized protein n=1 Tax=Pseudonocardia kunmingensis TaxID=630975 RepID=A0A543DQC1_9PSEU|nr:hypothetical protein [Pseudonocardia kunmingensis]TQM11509.1 hypothetical protein FB558_4072 [Pseudonocardia kunmingensis]
MDLRGFIRRFDLPAGFTAPSLLAFDDIRAYAITREHLAGAVRWWFRAWSRYRLSMVVAAAMDNRYSRSSRP